MQAYASGSAAAISADRGAEVPLASSPEAIMAAMVVGDL
jgi:hypothetical protein